MQDHPKWSNRHQQDNQIIFTFCKIVNVTVFGVNMTQIVNTLNVIRLELTVALNPNVPCMLTIPKAQVVMITVQ